MNSPNKKITKVLLAGFALLLINSSYLAGSADPTLIYFGNVALHILLGLVLLILFSIYLRRVILTDSKRAGDAGAANSRQMPLAMMAASVLLGLAAIFGIFLMV